MTRKQNAGLIIFCVLLLLWGCMEKNLTFQVRYDKVSSLRQNDPVYFEQSKVGTVQQVTYTSQGGYLVDLSITPEFKNTATVDSRFFITDDPLVGKGKAVSIVQEKPGGAVLKPGSIVQGSVRAGFLEEMMNSFKRNSGAAGDEMRRAVLKLKESLNETSRKLNRDLEGALDDLSRQFHGFSDEVRKVPDSEEVKQLQESIRQFADEFNKAQQDVRDNIRDDVLPGLRKELEELRELLRQQGREEEIREIDKQVEEMDMI